VCDASSPGPKLHFNVVPSPPGVTWGKNTTLLAEIKWERGDKYAGN